MSLPKVLGTITVLLFVLIAITALLKDKPVEEVSDSAIPIEVDLTYSQEQVSLPESNITGFWGRDSVGLPDADRVEEFFNVGQPQFPIVETVTYKSHVSWMRGRPAWLVDYAAHYDTSRHFIARSLNGKTDYITQKVANGDRFNVLRTGKNINFYLLVDVSRCRMWFYYLDLDTHERMLVKTYEVGIGRTNPKQASGLLTPLGKYTLGSNIAVYRPKMMGHHQGKKVEMVQVFGTRWIPFDHELEGCTAPARGLGIHGAPWVRDPASQQLAEDRNGVGAYVSDGCIRLYTEDMEELFSIIITRPAVLELVQDFRDAHLPGEERA